MTSEKLLETMQLMVDLDAQLKLQASLNQIRDNLTNLVGQPATPQYQSNLATANAAFTSGVSQLSSRITPSQFNRIAELGGQEFFAPSMADAIKEQIERNAMTPSVASAFVNSFTSRREAFLQTLNATINGLKNLTSAQSREADLAPGEAAFTIPRELFDDQLGKFSKELAFISLMTDHVSEAVSGQVKPVRLEYLASSVPVVAIGADIGVLIVLGKVINLFLDGWKKMEEIREIRGKLKSIGASGAAAEEMDEMIITTVEEVVEESKKLALSNYSTDDGRKNELGNALQIDFNRLFGQIERGLTVEIRTNEPAADSTDEEKDEAVKLDDIAKTLVFPVAAKTPMLLTSEEILEGAVSSKKVTTTTTRTIRKKPGAKADD